MHFFRITAETMHETSFQGQLFCAFLFLETSCVGIIIILYTAAVANGLVSVPIGEVSVVSAKGRPCSCRWLS